MTDSELVVLFALAMLAMALIAVAVDWVGKPIHRRFIPKIYRYPEELERPPDPTRTEWSDDTFSVPENPPDDQPMEYSDGSTEWSDSELVLPAPKPSPTANAALFAEMPEDPEPEIAAPAPAKPEPKTRDEVVTSQGPQKRSHPAEIPTRTAGWQHGQFIFNLTRDGEEPSVAVVRRRFWRNIGSSNHAQIFGTTNTKRIQTGSAPQRRNPVTGATETMNLPVADFATTKGKSPTPVWPNSGADPFAVHD